MSIGNTLPKQSYFVTFDTIRALAVLMVFVSHSGILFLLPRESAQRVISGLAPGNFGVILFFVLSGFLITRILIKNKGKKHAYRNFLVRRSLRIFPIYYITILVLLFIEPGMYLLECAAYISNYTFAFDPQPNPMRHTWSLGVEEHFYLVWPPIVLFLSTRMSKLTIFIFLPIISIGSAILTYRFIPEYASALFYRGTNYQVFALALGSVLAFQEDWLRASPLASFKASAVLYTTGILVGILLIGFHAPNTVTKFYTYTLISCGIICMTIGINDSNGKLCALLSNPVTSYIGKISYGLYLYHFPIYYFFGNLQSESATIPTIVLSTGVTFLVSIASFQFIEKPILRLKSRFA